MDSRSLEKCIRGLRKRRTLKKVDDCPSTIESYITFEYFKTEGFPIVDEDDCDFDESILREVNDCRYSKERAVQANTDNFTDPKSTFSHPYEICEKRASRRRAALKPKTNAQKAIKSSLKRKPEKKSPLKISKTQGVLQPDQIEHKTKSQGVLQPDQNEHKTKTQGVLKPHQNEHKTIKADGFYPALLQEDQGRVKQSLSGNNQYLGNHAVGQHVVGQIPFRKNDGFDAFADLGNFSVPRITNHHADPIRDLVAEAYGYEVPHNNLMDQLKLNDILLNINPAQNTRATASFHIPTRDYDERILESIWAMEKQLVDVSKGKKNRGETRECKCRLNNDSRKRKTGKPFNKGLFETPHGRTDRSQCACEAILCKQCPCKFHNDMAMAILAKYGITKQMVLDSCTNLDKEGSETEEDEIVEDNALDRNSYGLNFEDIFHHLDLIQPRIHDENDNIAQNE